MRIDTRMSRRALWAFAWCALAPLILTLCNKAQAAARCPEKVAAIVYVAAFLPQDGQSLIDLTELPEVGKIYQGTINKDDFVVNVRNGKKVTIDRVFLPGYVLVEMDLDNDLWHVIKNTPRVTGFLGTGDNPVALSEQEVSSILFRTETAGNKPTMKVKFDKGEQVRINEGPFANFTGAVDDINEDKQTLKVMVSIFGRSTPVEIEFSKVDKVVDE